MAGRPSTAERDTLRAIEPAFTVYRASGCGPLLLVCEHASLCWPATGILDSAGGIAAPYRLGPGRLCLGQSTG